MPLGHQRTPSLSNVEALANGWPDIDVDDPRLPTITA